MLTEFNEINNSICSEQPKYIETPRGGSPAAHEKRGGFGLRASS